MLLNKSVMITIWREDEPIEVSVEVLSYYRGKNDSDDPSCVETDTVGADEDGKTYELMDDEIRDAESAFAEEMNL